MLPLRDPHPNQQNPVYKLPCFFRRRRQSHSTVPGEGRGGGGESQRFASSSPPPPPRSHFSSSSSQLVSFLAEGGWRPAAAAVVAFQCRCLCCCSWWDENFFSSSPPSPPPLASSGTAGVFFFLVSLAMAANATTHVGVGKEEGGKREKSSNARSHQKLSSSPFSLSLSEAHNTTTTTTNSSSSRVVSGNSTTERLCNFSFSFFPPSLLSLSSLSPLSLSDVAALPQILPDGRKLLLWRRWRCCYFHQTNLLLTLCVYSYMCVVGPPKSPFFEISVSF